MAPSPSRNSSLLGRLIAVDILLEEFTQAFTFGVAAMDVFLLGRIRRQIVELPEIVGAVVHDLHRQNLAVPLRVVLVVCAHTREVNMYSPLDVCEKRSTFCVVRRGGVGVEVCP